MIGPFVQNHTPLHSLQPEACIQGREVTKPISVEDNVWIKGGAILLPRAGIDRNAIVRVGAVLSQDIPANAIVAGNPARGSET
jgi:maltose O-acetyltransferase